MRDGDGAGEDDGGVDDGDTPMKTAVPPFVAWVAVRWHACLLSGILPVRRQVARQRDRQGVEWLELQCPSEDACRKDRNDCQSYSKVANNLRMFRIRSIRCETQAFPLLFDEDKIGGSAIEYLQEADHKCVCSPHSPFSRRLWCVLGPGYIHCGYNRDGFNRIMTVPGECGVRAGRGGASFAETLRMVYSKHAGLS